MIYITAILVYLAGLLFVALRQVRKVKTQADFSVAGRTLSVWILVLTMLATWVGTGSILGNAGKAYAIGLGAMILPVGPALGMILLVFIAPKVRNFDTFSVPEIIEARFGFTARVMAVLALVAAYLVIVSYQFNAGGGVLQYAVGKKEPTVLSENQTVTAYQLRKGYVYFVPSEGFTGRPEICLRPAGPESGDTITIALRVVPAEKVQEANIEIHQQGLAGWIAAAPGQKVVLRPVQTAEGRYSVASISGGTLFLQEYKLSIRQATLIAAAFIIAFTMIAGMVSIAYIDIGNGILIIGSLLAAFAYLWNKAGGWEGISTALAAMGRGENMRFWAHLDGFSVINLCLPAFLLVLGDANLYQRFFSSKSAAGAKQATLVLIFAALLIEILIIGCGWTAGALIPDAEEGKYVLIAASRYLMPAWLGCIFMTNIVAIIMSTADSFLLVPSASLIRDIYKAYLNPSATEKQTLFLSRLMVLCLGAAAFLISMTFDRVPGFLSRALYAYTIYGSSITPALVAALFWKGATRHGAVASILCGTAMTLLWRKMTFMAALLGSYYTMLDEVLPAITVSVTVLVVVSWLTARRQTKTPLAAA
ncbi:MAG: sodium:solute symporter family protein [Phycisphaerae bacterium]|nr:sodium:solute symporter family protein [Phycisphaerae bacterium]